MLNGIGIIDIALVVLIRPCDKREERIILNQARGHFDRVFLPPIAKRIDIITSGRNANHQLICIGALGFLEAIVLCRFFVCRHLIRNGKIAVERILAVRV